MSNAKTKYEHHIPQFILRTFLNGTNFQLYDKSKRSFLTKGASNSMGKDYFYEHVDFPRNNVENLLRERENLYAPLIKKIIEGGDVTNGDYRLLAEFRHVTYYRSNEFIGFHTFKKNRSENSWVQRWDWRSLHGFYSQKYSKDDMRKTQLKAIQNVINGTDEAFLLSLMTPICFKYTTQGKKFAIGDSGSISMCEDESHGIIVIVISPNYALGFPRIISASEMIKKIGIHKKYPMIITCDIDDSIVDKINNFTITQAYEYYIDPNHINSKLNM